MEKYDRETSSKAVRKKKYSAGSKEGESECKTASFLRKWDFYISGGSHCQRFNQVLLSTRRLTADYHSD
jgi:hypothetical protein